MSDEKQHEEMVVGGVEHRPQKKLRRRQLQQRILIGVAVGVLAIVGVSTLYALLTREEPVRIKVTASDLPDDYMSLTDAEVARKFGAKTGLAITEITEKKISGKTLKTFDDAYQAGQALYALDEYGRAADAYALADKKSDGKADYNFYLRYSDAAVFNKEAEKSLELLDTAKKAIASDSKLSAERKKLETETIDQKIHLRKLGY